MVGNWQISQVIPARNKIQYKIKGIKYRYKIGQFSAYVYYSLPSEIYRLGLGFDSDTSGISYTSFRFG